VDAESVYLPDRLTRVVQDILIGKSSLRQTIELYADEPFLRISHDIDWKEHHQMLRTHFHPSIHSGTATYGIQGGVIKRSAKPKNAWEEAQFEVPAQRFADLSEPGYGCALICDSKYGYRIRDGEMELNLLRSPADVDPVADQHRHRYSYAFYPHAGDYEHSDVFRVAHSFGEELLVCSCAALPSPASVSFFHVDSDHVCLSTVKPAEQGGGIILRLHEYKGKAGRISLRSHPPYPLARLCNLLEEPLQRLEGDSSRLWELDFTPFEIKTLLLQEER